MSIARTSLRAAAVLGATAAMTVAGAGVAAAATTPTTNVDGNTVSVTFEWESDGILDRTDTCGAAAVEPAAAIDLATAFAGGDLGAIFNSLINEPGVHILYEDGIIIDSPVVFLGDLKRSATMEAEVDTGVYTVVSVCGSTATNPKIEPVVLVGNPVEAVLGSVESFSAGGAGLGTLSSALGGGEGDDAGLGVLSSALGGGDGEGGGPLDMLSSTLGEPAGN